MADYTKGHAVMLYIHADGFSSARRGISDNPHIWPGHPSNAFGVAKAAAWRFGWELAHAGMKQGKLRPL